MVVRVRANSVARAKGVSLGKRQQEADVAYNTVKRMVKGLYAIPTTQTLSTPARALGVAPAAVLAKVPGDTTTIDADRVGTRGEERCLTMGPRDDSGRFSLRTIVGAFFLVCCLLHEHPSCRWAIRETEESRKPPLSKESYAQEETTPFVQTEAKEAYQ